LRPLAHSEFVRSKELVDLVRNAFPHLESKVSKDLGDDGRVVRNVAAREEHRDGLAVLRREPVLEEPLHELPGLVHAPLGDLRQDDHLVRDGLDGLASREGDQGSRGEPSDLRVQGAEDAPLLHKNLLGREGDEAPPDIA